MKPAIPVVESVADHQRSFARIAAWLFECLDTSPPAGGGHLVLYLCYHASDRGFFSSPQRNLELARALVDRYQQELAWDGMEFGDLLFDLTNEPNQESIYLALRDPEPVEGSSEKSSTNQSTIAKSTVLEFSWRESESLLSPGTLSLTRCWVDPLPLNRVMTGFVSAASSGGIAISRHIDLWQHHARGSQPKVYLVEGLNRISIGETSGCDIWAPQLEAPLLLDYNAATNEWRWFSPSAPWLPQGRQVGDLFLEYGGGNDKPPLVLTAQSWVQPRSLKDLMQENRMPSFVMEIVGCLLPTPTDQSSRDAVFESQPVLVGLATSAIEVPGGAWLYSKKDSAAPYLLRAGEAPPGRALTLDGVDHELRLRPGKGPKLKGKWIEYSHTWLPRFRGELSLTPPLTSRLSSDAICGDLPSEIFPEYVDRSLGRPPVRLESGDGRTYTLAFNASAKHPVFVFSKTTSEVRQYDPSPTQAIDLGTGADFILGATHYRLRQLPESPSDETSAR